MDSVQARINWAVSEGLQGIGFWALQYESGVDGFWEIVQSETVLSPSIQTQKTQRIPRIPVPLKNPKISSPSPMLVRTSPSISAKRSFSMRAPLPIPTVMNRDILGNNVMVRALRFKVQTKPKPRFPSPRLVPTYSRSRL